MNGLLAILLDAQSIILEVSEKFKLKKYNIDPPGVYPGWGISKKSFDGQEMWTMSSVDYVKAVINNPRLT